MGMRYIGIRIHLHRLQFLVMIKLFDYMIKNGRLFISSKRLLRFFFLLIRWNAQGLPFQGNFLVSY